MSEPDIDALKTPDGHPRRIVEWAREYAGWAAMRCRAIDADRIRVTNGGDKEDLMIGLHNCGRALVKTTLTIDRLVAALAESNAARERTERALRRTIETEWGQVHAWHMDMIGELPPDDLDAVVLSLYAAPPEPATPNGDAR